MNSGNDFAANVATYDGMARKAAAAGAKLILSPEYFLMMDGTGRVMREAALDEQGEPALSRITALARELEVWLLAGSVTLKSGEGRMCNRSVLVSADGEVVATYDKIHMFDATLPNGTVIRESSAYRPGERAVLAQTPWGAYLGALVVSAPDRQGALAFAAAGPGDRERVLHTGARHVRRSSGQPAELWAHAGGRSLGRDHRRRR
jgi:predicted amidohydrolase